MTATERRLSEQQFHDRQAADRALTFQRGRAELRFQDDEYLDHETWIRPAMTRLGHLAGKCVLDYGCGHGMAAVVLARAGATVTAFDLSPGYVREAQDRLVANGVMGTCVTADAEELPFVDAAFDAVWGNAILHHLDLKRAGHELYRVLKPGGIAVFCEPWGGNPVLSFARRFLPYPGKDRTPDEQPLTRRDLCPLRAIFPQVEVEGFQLFGMVRRLARGGARTRYRSALRVADAVDRTILRWFPPLRNWCRYMVITLRRW